MDKKGAIKNYFFSQKNVVCVYLFGSAAAEKENKFSDVDIGVIFSGDISREQYSQMSLSIMDDLSRILDKDVDVVVLNQAAAFLKFQIIKSGLRIYEQQHRKSRDFEARAIIEYFDFLPVRRKLEAALMSNIKEG